MKHTELWYHQPAKLWTEALPLGNGKLGAMVFGGPHNERLQINDGTAWSGSPASEFSEPQIAPDVARAALADARASIAAEDYIAADASLKRIQHRHSQSYLPFIELDLAIRTAGTTGENQDVRGYRRSLDLATATHETNYVLAGQRVTQRTFVSHEDGVLVHEIRTDQGEFEVQVSLSSLLRVLSTRAENDRGELALLLKMPSDVAPVHDEVTDPVAYSDDDSLSMQGAGLVRVTHDGGIRTIGDDGKVHVKSTRAVTIYVATETTFAGIAKQPEGYAEDAYASASERVEVAAEMGPERLHRRHVAEYSALYSRVEIETGTAPDLPTDERLRIGNASPRGPVGVDPALVADLFNYGRYLLISSSRKGGVPANLQGIWNDSLQPVWSSNYTTNINLPMNYWMAEDVGLPECLPPLFDLIDALSRTGRRVAQELYDAPGWAVHHNTDIWAYPLPVGGGEHDPKWAFWPLAGAWLVRHYWERVLHGADADFIRQHAWRPTRSAAEFALAWLVEQGDGTLGTTPSTSPENQFFTPNGQVASSARSSTFDLVVIADLFDIIAEYAARLSIIDDPIVDAAIAARERIPSPRIGRDGMVQEWLDDFAFPDPTHRHVAHLYFLHPSDWEITPELALAATRSLDGRGDESTGWSLAWKLLMRARLGQASKVSDLMKLVFRDMEIDRGPWIGGLYPNLMAAHPPFQIDGNFGFVSGVAECILQSHAGYLELLKGIPAELSSGSIRGLRARPGLDVDIVWSADNSHRAELVSATFRASVPSARGQHVVKYGGDEITISVADEPVKITQDSFRTLSSRVQRV